jgi:hypothetical protein
MDVGGFSAVAMLSFALKERAFRAVPVPLHICAMTCAADLRRVREQRAYTEPLN